MRGSPWPTAYLTSHWRWPSRRGRRQRVALARAFAARPALLLYDEVTSALDVSVQATILELIARLTTTFGTTVVFVSHDLAVVRALCRRAVVLRAGVICEDGPGRADLLRLHPPLHSRLDRRHPCPPRPATCLSPL